MQSWVVVASAARARVFSTAGKHEPWQEVFDLVNPEERQLRQEMVSDKPGRVIASARGQHHTLTSTYDPKERAADGFARELIAKLEEELDKGSFAHMTLVAPPRFLGLLREHMTGRLNAAVLADLDKDLTREDVATLQTHVSKLV